MVPVQGGLMGCLPHLAPARKGLMGSGGMAPCHGVPPPSCTGPEGSDGACRGGPMGGLATDWQAHAGPRERSLVSTSPLHHHHQQQPTTHNPQPTTTTTTATSTATATTTTTTTILPWGRSVLLPTTGSTRRGILPPPCGGKLTSKELSALPIPSSPAQCREDTILNRGSTRGSMVFCRKYWAKTALCTSGSNLEPRFNTRFNVFLQEVLGQIAFCTEVDVWAL